MSRYHNCDKVLFMDESPRYMPDGGYDPVSRPKHYVQGGVETIDVIEAWKLDYHLGNAVKYISRAGKKDPAKTLEDLEKARWYLDREIMNLRKRKWAEEGLPDYTGARK